MFKDHEFDPVTPEEEARRRQEEEFARRVRREVLRIERGEADEDIRADMEREEEEKAEVEERQRRERRVRVIPEPGRPRKAGVLPQLRGLHGLPVLHQPERPPVEPQPVFAAQPRLPRLRFRHPRRVGIKRGITGHIHGIIDHIAFHHSCPQYVERRSRDRFQMGLCRFLKIISV